MKSIPGYTGYYATDNGLIISLRSGSPRVLKQRIHKGYYHVFIRKGIGRKYQVSMPVHQLVLFAFVGERKTNQVCRHLNGNSLDNRLTNLKWGTTQENLEDSIKHGTAICLRHGEEHPRSKLKEEDIIKISLLLDQGKKQSEIASMFNISQRHVSDIKLHNTWKHLWGA